MIVKLQKKLQKIFGILALVGFVCFTVYAEPCSECKKLHVDLEKEMKLRESYLVLKVKNEDYLKKPNVIASAAIKVRSNLMLLGIKIETQDNKIEALQNEKKKLNNCVNCSV